MSDTNNETRNAARSAMYHQLAAAMPLERARIVLETAHSVGRIALPPEQGVSAQLEGLDLSQATLQREAQDRVDVFWWDRERRKPVFRQTDLRGANLRLANFRGADLHSSDFEAAILRQSDLRDVVLETACLRNTDLAGSDMRAANLEQADLEGATLEDAQLQYARLRFANLSDAVLEGANLEQADLWSARLPGAILRGANLRGARLEEANLTRAELIDADLQHAILRQANCEAANLHGANLQGAQIRGLNLRAAVLQHTKLQGLDLTTCTITHIHLSGAWLEKTKLQREQLGGAIGEELSGDYEEARKGYLALEHNFLALGDPDAASWAYRKKRRMQKRAAREAARTAYDRGDTRGGIFAFSSYLRHVFVEWLCDYGESIGRVLLSMMVVYSLFVLLYAVTGSVVEVSIGSAGEERAVTRDPVDLAIFSLLAMTTSGSPVVGLQPRTEAVHLLTGVQAFIGIALTGLLGFIIGNRIRR